MSDEPKRRSRAWIGWALVTLLVLVAGLASWMLTISAPKVDATGPGTPAHRGPPYMPKIPDRVPPQKVATIAIEEVKKREGWTGKAGTPDREVSTWYVVVRHDPSTPDADRVVGIDAETFRVDEYRALDGGPVP
jgi:hypothetical protein